MRKIKIEQPPIGIEVAVKTAYGFNDTGFWNGTEWVNSSGEFKGTVDEAPEWRFKNEFSQWLYPPCYPPLIEGQNYSENVFAHVDGYTDLQVMCYIYVEGDDGGFMWATCNKTLDGDAELDDNYDVVKWQYIPKI